MKAAARSMPLSMPSLVKSEARLSYHTCRDEQTAEREMRDEIKIKRETVAHLEAHALKLEVDGY